ncbi:MAG: hypothetical protein ACREBF_04535 [Candidatus Micrarchaeales archaeon]
MEEHIEKELAILVTPCMDGRLVDTMLVLTNLDMSAQEKKEELKKFIKEETKTYKDACEMVDKVEKLVSFVPERNVKFVVASNAGANVDGLKITLPKIVEQFEILGYVNISHNKCGAGKKEAELVVGNVSEEDEECRHFGIKEIKSNIPQKILESNDIEAVRSAIENASPDIQCGRAGKLFSNVISFYANVDELILREYKPEETKYFMTGNWTADYPGVMNGKPIGYVYPILAEPKDRVVDVDVATKLNLVQYDPSKEIKFKPVKSF